MRKSNRPLRADDGGNGVSAGGNDRSLGEATAEEAAAEAAAASARRLRSKRQLRMKLQKRRVPLQRQRTPRSWLMCESEQGVPTNFGDQHGGQTIAPAIALQGGSSIGPAQGVGSGLHSCPVRMPQWRIAMVIPWVGTLPLWSSYVFICCCCRAAGRLPVFHEPKSLVPIDSPPNVIFTDLGQVV